jgi:hypothetical protein
MSVPVRLLIFRFCPIWSVRSGDIPARWPRRGRAYSTQRRFCRSNRRSGSSGRSNHRANAEPSASHAKTCKQQRLGDSAVSSRPSAGNDTEVSVSSSSSSAGPPHSGQTRSFNGRPPYLPVG